MPLEFVRPRFTGQHHLPLAGAMIAAVNNRLLKQRNNT